MNRFVSYNKRLFGKSKAILLGLVLAFTLSASFLPAAIKTASALTAADSGNTTSSISDSDIASAASQYCNTSLQSILGNDTTSPDAQALTNVCQAGYTDGFKQDPSKSDACKTAVSGQTSISGKVTTKVLQAECEQAYDAGKADGPQARDTATDAVIAAAASQYCSGKPGGPCQAGYVAGYKGSPSKSTACKTYASNHSLLTACQDAYDAGATAGSAVDASRLVNPTGNAVNTTDNASANRQLGCDTEITNPLTWILCPTIGVLNGMVDTLDGWITDMLNVDSNQIFGDGNTGQAYYKAWSSFRNIALGLMVIAGLVVLIAQAVGMEILDAYTIRKVLPRILIAALGITLSWPLMQFFINLTNDLGLGIRHLIYAPFSNLGGGIDLSFSHTIGGGLENFFFGTAGLATAVVGTIIFIGIILSLAGTAALAVLIAFVVLILRQVAVILLVLIAPIAIVTYILPNTQKMYQFWWDSFSKALLMFPIIAAFIATGRVFSAITLASDTSILSKIIGFLAYFAPYFLIPLTFRFAGGFVRQLGGFVNDRSKGVFDRLRQGRSRQMQQIGQDVKSGQALRILGANRPEFLRRIDRGLQNTSHIGQAGINPLGWRSNVRAAVKKTTGVSRNKFDSEEEVVQVRAFDDLMQAAAEAEGDTGRMRDILNQNPKFSAPEVNNMMADYDRARASLQRKGYTPAAIDQGLFLNGLMAKTAFTGDQYWEDYETDENGKRIEGTGTYVGASKVLEHIERLSGGDLSTKAQLIGKAIELSTAAGRPDLVAGFSESLIASKEMGKVSGASEEVRKETRIQVAKKLARKVVYKNGARALASSGHSARHLIGTYHDIVQEAVKVFEDAKQGKVTKVEVPDPESGDMKTIEIKNTAEAERHLKQAVANLAYLQEVNGSLPPEVQGLIGELMGQRVGVATTAGIVRDGSTSTGGVVIPAGTDTKRDPTLQELTDGYRGDVETQQFKYDLLARSERERKQLSPTERAAYQTAQDQANRGSEGPGSRIDPNIGSPF